MLSRSLLRGGLAACGFALVTSARSANAQVETPRDYDEAPPPPSPASEAGPVSPVRAATTPTPGVRSESYWYGWQTASSDAASIAVVLVGSATHASVVSAVGVGGMFFGAPAVHFANERGAIGVASFALRVSLPLFGGFVGYAAAGTCHDDPKSTSFLGNCFLHGYNEAAIGGLVGLGSAMVIDASAARVRQARDRAARAGARARHPAHHIGRARLRSAHAHRLDGHGRALLDERARTAQGAFQVPIFGRR